MINQFLFNCFIIEDDGVIILQNVKSARPVTALHPRRPQSSTEPQLQWERQQHTFKKDKESIINISTWYLTSLDPQTFSVLHKPTGPLLYTVSLFSYPWGVSLSVLYTISYRGSPLCGFANLRHQNISVNTWSLSTSCNVITAYTYNFLRLLFQPDSPSTSTVTHKPFSTWIYVQYISCLFPLIPICSFF